MQLLFHIHSTNMAFVDVDKHFLSITGVFNHLGFCTPYIHLISLYNPVSLDYNGIFTVFHCVMLYHLHLV